jgi:hypothetical protein
MCPVYSGKDLGFLMTACCFVCSWPTAVVNTLFSQHHAVRQLYSTFSDSNTQTFQSHLECIRPAHKSPLNHYHRVDN